jgi:hypothetical protein
MGDYEQSASRVSKYAWIVIIAVICLMVIISIIGLHHVRRKRELKRKAAADRRRAEDDKIFSDIIREKPTPLTVPKPVRPLR